MLRLRIDYRSFDAKYNRTPHLICSVQVAEAPEFLLHNLRLYANLHPLFYEPESASCVVRVHRTLAELKRSVPNTSVPVCRMRENELAG